MAKTAREYLVLIYEDPNMKMTERSVRAHWLERQLRTIMHDDSIKVYVNDVTGA